MQIKIYQARNGKEPVTDWLNGLDRVTAMRVTQSLARLEAGNTSNLKSVGHGVQELKLRFGPGYRVYLGWDGAILIILLTGGTKQRQSKDIAQAQSYWADYKKRKQEGR